MNVRRSSFIASAGKNSYLGRQESFPRQGKENAIHCKFPPKTQKICSALQIYRKSFVYLQRISFFASLNRIHNK